MHMVKSPLVESGETKLITSILVKDIISLYKTISDVEVQAYFKDLEKVDLYECCTTGYRFYYPFNLAGDGQFYADLQAKKKEQQIDYYRDWEYDNQFAFRFIKQGDKLLEVGCGTGKFLQKAMEKSTDICGLELNKAAVSEAVAKGLNAKLELVQDHAATMKGQYDIVCAFQVLEHVPDVFSFLDGMIRCLKKGGQLIIGVPNNEPYFQRFNKYETFNLPPHHMGLWNEKAFKSLEKIFPLKMHESVYAPVKERVLVDAYLRTKLWTGVKSLPRHHSLIDKLKMLAIAPISVPISLVKQYTDGINGAYIAVNFTKL